MKFKAFTSSLLAAAFMFASAMSLTVNAQNAPALKKQQYRFKAAATPEQLERCGCAVFYETGNSAYTTQGQKLHELGLDVLDFTYNPSGVNFMLISADKKANKGVVYSAFAEDEEQFTFKNKKFGNPTAAVYTPDARKLLVAANGNLIEFDSRTFQPTDTLSISIEPKRMTMSSNAYFIAMDDGKKVVVYNYQDKKPRQTFRFEDDVMGVEFNKDASELAILSSDGILTIYDTRTFMPKKTIDDFEGGVALDYNFDGKYIAVATTPETIEIINLLDLNDRDKITVAEGNVNDIKFIKDISEETLLVYSTLNALMSDRLNKLAPYYGKLISEEANEMLNEWLKMMPGETMEQYNARVNDETRRKQLRMYEDEISTRYADDLLTMSTVSLGKYDRTNQVLQVDFDNMPSIFLPVPEGNLGGFNNAADLEFRNAKFGVMTDDKFELIYAQVYNKADGQTYTYNNIDRVPLSFMEDDDNVVSIEIIQQQMMEEIKLQEIKKNVVEEAKSQNIISEHTNIAVDSRVEPSYDAEGNKILNYLVKFTYEVDPAFTVTEDFAPGKYHAEQSGAASSMLKIVKQAFEGDFAQYIADGKKVQIKISGTADATPIVSTIKYDGSYGEFVNEPVYKDGQLSALTVTTKEPVKENEQLAFLRAAGVKNYLENNVENLKNMDTDFQYHIAVSNDKGSQFRRITTEFTFIDAF